MRSAALVICGLLLALETLPAAEPPTEAREEEPVLGAPSGFGPLPAEERQALPAGAVLRQRPEAAAPPVTVLDVATELEVLARRGGWVQVRWGAFKGWAWTGHPTAAGSEVDRLIVEVARSGPPPEVLARARRLTGAAGDERRLGPFTLLTDVGDAGLLARLDAVAASLEKVYRERFGLDPGDPRGEVVVLFARGEDYRAFSAATPALAGLDAHGHAGGGLAALAAEGREETELTALLVHELTHLLNRRAFEAELPPWIEEGLAEDLAYCQVDASGRLEPATLGGAGSERRDFTFLAPGRLGRVRKLELSGARSALSRLLAGWQDPGRAPLAELVELGWRQLVDPARRQLLYPESAFFVRFLLDGDDPGRRRGLLSYLAALADPEAGSPELEAHLASPLPALEAPFHDWLRRQGARHLPAEMRPRP